MQKTLQILEQILDHPRTTRMPSALDRASLPMSLEQATESDRGDVIVSAMIEHLRERRILLPAAATLEKIALAQAKPPIVSRADSLLGGKTKKLRRRGVRV